LKLRVTIIKIKFNKVGLETEPNVRGHIREVGQGAA
jgi:hypothetical protein